jgi:hypothetical protein
MPAKRLRPSFYSLAGSERQRDCRESRASITGTGFVRQIGLLSTFVGQGARNDCWTFPRIPRNFAALRRLISQANKAVEETVIEVDLTAAAYELVREGVTLKSRKGGVYKVLMPRNLAAGLDAERAVGEDMSDAILRLAREAKAAAKPHPFR